jgi:hypothetical protein
MALAITAVKPIRTTTSIGTGQVVLYTCPANTYATLQYLTFVNITTASVVNTTVTLYLVPSGGSVGTTNIILPGYTILATDPTLALYYNQKHLLAPGDFLVCSTSVAASVNFIGAVTESQAL